MIAGYQITETISAWKVCFRSPGEIYACNLESTLIVLQCTQREENFFGSSVLNTVMGKIKKVAEARSKGGRQGGRG